MSFDKLNDSSSFEISDSFVSSMVGRRKNSKVGESDEYTATFNLINTLVGRGAIILPFSL